jgi:hypothetical protein
MHYKLFEYGQSKIPTSQIYESLPASENHTWPGFQWVSDDYSIHELLNLPVHRLKRGNQTTAVAETATTYRATSLYRKAGV